MSPPEAPEPYAIELTPKAARALERLPRKELGRIDSKILALGDEPRPRSCVKIRGHDDLYRVRSGEYRIVYEVDDDRRVVTVLVIGHRRDVYDNL